MRILVVTPFFYPHVGGSQSYMEDLYAYVLSSHKDVRVDVLCYNTLGSPKTQTYKRIRIIRISCWNILTDQFCIPHPFELISFLFSHRSSYDLIHASTRFFDSSLWTPLWAKIIGVPCILTDHCVGHPIHKNLLIGHIATLIDNTLVRVSLQAYDRVFATSKAAQSFLKKTFGINAKVHYAGVDTTFFTPSEKRTSRKIRVVYAGRMIGSKGVEELFETAKKMPFLQWIFVGPGTLEKQLQRRVQNEDLNHIRIRGEVDKRTLARILSCSDIFVHPSFHHEGFPGILLEAGASKLAVIATDVGGSKEIVIPNKTGILIPPKDQDALQKAVMHLVGNKMLRKNLATALYNHVRKHFDVKKTSEQFIAPLLPARQ
ncbi:MAG: hypothetical protein A3J69_02210 [Candidatus Levybacteria bacterium RIFCSPHIGHO2_02_FULL_42_12]|nr:MAG: hypothetical protein A3J69_02210 [Candidatus Levybacteria bacterium RIFCSPHIGHO2_02_FULL_42_12]